MGSTANQENLFLVACVQNDLEQIRSFVERGCPVNCHVDSRFGKEFSGYTPLHFAVKYKNIDAQIYLLKKGADITEKSANSWTPVHLAYYTWKDDTVHKIFEYSKVRTYQHVIDDTGLTHFHICCALDVPVVQKFITSEAKINCSVSLAADKNAGFTPLHFAAENGHMSTTTLLLENGANLQLKCGKGFTPLHLACKNSRLSVVELLLTYDADLNTLRTKDNKGRTALHHAAEQGSVSIVKLLMEYGASICKTDNKNQTPFDVSIKCWQYDVFDVMFPQCKNEDGTPVSFSTIFSLDDLHDACIRGDLKGIKMFLKHGFSVNSHAGSNAKIQFRGYTPLHYAVENKRLDIVTYLLSEGADITKKNDFGFTPVHLACQKQNHHVIIKIFEHSNINTYVDVADENGRTHFHICCTLDAPNIIEGFIKNGVDINCSTLLSDPNPGFTPLHFAIKACCKSTVELLSKNGADPLAKCAGGITPVNMVCNNSFDTSMARFVLNNVDLTIRYRENRLLLHHVFYRNPNNSLNDWILDQMSDQIQTDYNYGDSRRLSLLHIACFRGKTNIVKRLLDQGCCPNSRIVFKEKDNFASLLFVNINSGVTPLHIAFFKKDALLAKQLIMAGADINMEDDEGHSPVAYIDSANWNLRSNPRLCNLVPELDEFVARLISKLATAKLYVSDNVKRAFSERIREVFWQRMFTEIITDERLCEIEFKKMESIQINGCAGNLRSILHRNEKELYKLVQNEDAMTFLNPEYLNNLSKEFPIYGFMIKAQVNKGLRVVAKVRKAKDALHGLTDINWPDRCSELILIYLGIEHIENLIYANIV